MFNISFRRRAAMLASNPLEDSRGEGGDKATVLLNLTPPNYGQNFSSGTA